MSADIDALAWQPTVRCVLEFDFLDVVVVADGTPYASLADGCTAEERHSRPGQGIVRHPVSGPRPVGTGGAATACHAAAALPAAAPNPAAAAAAWSVGQRPDLRQWPEVRTVRGRRLRAPIQLVRLPRGRVRVMIVARTSTGRTVVHTRRYRTCAR